MTGLLTTIRPTGTIAPQSVRYLNQLRALNLLFREGGMSRADLARSLGLNRSTTGNIITDLLADALVTEHVEATRPTEAAPRTGRPGIDVTLNRTGATFIGAGIETDRLIAVAIDLNGAITQQTSAPFQAARHSPERAAHMIAEMVNVLIAAAPDVNRVRGACVAVPGMMAGDTIRQALLLGWRDAPLAALVKAHLSVDRPVLVENDANAFAIAETYRGATRQMGTVAVILIESGAGGGIVINGRLFRGGFGLAGEFGHLRVGKKVYAAGRSGSGLLESYIGKEAVLARYAARGGGPHAALSDLMAALERGETAALRTADDWAQRLVRGLVHIINVINPGLVIVGGAVGAMIRFVGPRVEALLREQMPQGYPLPTVEMSRLGPEGSALGGALLLHQRMFSIDEKAFYPDGGAQGLFQTVGD